MKYFVEKRMINNYLVEVEANSPEEAIQEAFDNNHEPGELTSNNEDGETFYPSEWRVYDSQEDNAQPLEVKATPELAELDNV